MLVGHDADDIAFAWVKFHLPHVFPFFESQDLLEVGSGLAVFNFSVQKAVVCKKSALECWTASGRSLIYICQNEKGP